MTYKPGERVVCVNVREEPHALGRLNYARFESAGASALHTSSRLIQVTQRGREGGRSLFGRDVLTTPFFHFVNQKVLNLLPSPGTLSHLISVWSE